MKNYKITFMHQDDRVEMVTIEAKSEYGAICILADICPTLQAVTLVTESDATIYDVKTYGLEL